MNNKFEFIFLLQILFFKKEILIVFEIKKQNRKLRENKNLIDELFLLLFSLFKVEQYFKRQTEFSFFIKKIIFLIGIGSPIFLLQSMNTNIKFILEKKLSGKNFRNFLE